MSRFQMSINLMLVYQTEITCGKLVRYHYVTTVVLPTGWFCLHRLCLHLLQVYGDYHNDCMVLPLQQALFIFLFFYFTAVRFKSLTLHSHWQVGTNLWKFYVQASVSMKHECYQDLQHSPASRFIPLSLKLITTCTTRYRTLPATQLKSNFSLI